MLKISNTGQAGGCEAVVVPIYVSLVPGHSAAVAFVCIDGGTGGSGISGRTVRGLLVDAPPMHSVPLSSYLIACDKVDDIPRRITVGPAGERPRSDMRVQPSSGDLAAADETPSRLVDALSIHVRICGLRCFQCLNCFVLWSAGDGLNYQYLAMSCRPMIMCSAPPRYRSR